MADTHTRRYLQALFSASPASVTPLLQTSSSSLLRTSTDTPSSLSGSPAILTDGSSTANTSVCGQAVSSSQAAANAPPSDNAPTVASDDQLHSQLALKQGILDGSSRAVANARIGGVLKLLHDEHISEDDKPEALRSLLAQYSPESANSLDDLDETVLAILHRHREDVKPTGQTFAAQGFPKAAPLSRSSSFRRNLTPTSASNLALKRTGAMTPTRPISPSPLRADSPSIHLYRSREYDSLSTNGSSAPSSPFSSPKMLNIGAVEFKPNVSAAEFKPSLMNQRSSSKLAAHSNEPRVERFRSASPMGTPAFDSPTLWAFNSSPLGTPRIATASPSGVAHTGSYFAAQQHATPIDASSSAIPADPWSSTANSSAVSTVSNPSITHSASTASSESSYDEVTFDPFAEQRQTSTGKAQILLDEDEDEDEFGLPTDMYGRTPGGSSPLAGLSDREIPNNENDPNEIDDLRILQYQNGQLVADGLELVEPRHQQRPTFDEQYVPQSTAQYSLIPDPASFVDDDHNSKTGPAGLGASTSSYVMTPFDVLCSVFAGSDVTANDLEEALTRNGWDVDKSMDWIINHLQSMRSTTIPPTGVDLEGLSRLRLSSPTNLSSHDHPASAAFARSTPKFAPTSRPTIVSHDSFQRQLSARSRHTLGVHYDSRPTTPGGRSDRSGGDGYMSEKNGPSTRLCKYFLQGNCLRSDCRFSHDLSKAVCKFWLRGHCLKGEDRCEFLHSVPPHLAQDVAQLRIKAVQDREREKARMLERAYPRENTESPVEEDFPTLAAASASMQARSLSGTLLPKDIPPPSRWAGAVKNGRPVTAHVPVNTRPSLPKHASASAARETAGRDRLIPFSQPRRSHRIALRPPTLLPTVSTGADVARLYDQYRETFFEFGDARNKCLVKASQCWKSGDGAGARRWSKEAQDWNKQIAREGATAAKHIIRARKDGLREAAVSGQSRPGRADESNDRSYRGKECAGGLGICLGVAAVGDALGPEGSRLSASERTEVALDLHGLHPDEALEILEQFLTNLASENTMRGLAYVIVGQERHTGTADSARGSRKLRLADAVGTWLDEYEYSFWLTNGIYAIDPY